MSLPSRERGLNQFAICGDFVLYSVAPLAGAWIETRPRRSQAMSVVPSLPSRERGLKQLRALGLTEFEVAPLAGAWIETLDISWSDQ